MFNPPGKTNSMPVKENKSLCRCFELQSDLALSDIPEIQRPWSVDRQTKSWLEERFTVGKQHNQSPKRIQKVSTSSAFEAIETFKALDKADPFMVSGSFICWGGSEAMHGGGFNTDGRKALQGAVWIWMTNNHMIPLENSFMWVNYADISWDYPSTSYET